MIQKSTKLRNEAGTPRHLFQQWDGEYEFTVDVCATPHNTKMSLWIGEESDGLLCEWSGRVWCNPPYSDIPPWLAKAHEPEFAAYLLPVRSDRLWWRKWKPRAECHYIIGQKPHTRPQFEPPPGIKYSSNPMSLCLFLFGKGCMPGTEWYRSGRTGELL